MSAITVRILAGNGNGLPKYQEMVHRHTKLFELTILEEGKHCKCNSIALGIIAIIIAGGAAALLAFSGGPHAFNFLIPGSALTGVAIALPAWLCIMIGRAIQHHQKQKRILKQATEQSVKFKDALNAMRQQGVSLDHIKNALSIFPPEARSAFMEYVYDEMFKKNALPLTSKDKNILEAFAKFPSDLFKLKDHATWSRTFALEILSHISPQLIDEDTENEVLFARLFAKAGVPQTESEDAIFARHPIAIAMYAQKNLFTPWIVANICSQMRTMEQQTAFLKKFGDSLLLDQERSNDNVAIALRAISTFLTEDFAAQCNPFGGNPSKEQVIQRQKAFRLLTQIARFPLEAGQCIYLDCQKSLIEHHAMIDILWQKMLPEQQETLLSIASTMSLQHQIIERLVHYIERSASADRDLPEATQKIFAKMPSKLAQIRDRLHSDKAKSIVNQICKWMTVDEALIYQT